MVNAFSLFRTLVIYGICLPLAIFLGYLVASPEDTTNDTVVGLVLIVLVLPLVLKWHHPILILAWNTFALVFFLPGNPSLALCMCLVSCAVSILQYALNKNIKFISVPSISWPLICLTVVVVATAKLTGGIGLRVAGSDTYGGRRYIWIFGAVIGYFALTARRIPPEKVIRYAKMFFLAAATCAIGDLVSILAPSLSFVFLIFPGGGDLLRQSVGAEIGGENLVRFSGIGGGCSAIFIYMLAVYGIREIINPRRPWRALLFALMAFGAALGGFRSALLYIVLVFMTQFYFEGLMRSRLLPIMVMGILISSALVIPFSLKLPLAMQRAISFLPIDVDPIARSNAEGSTDWRLRMWARAFPEVPHYLLLGKGYGMDPAEANMLRSGMTRGVDDFELAYIAGDYHNGPLSLLMPFGIWGTIAFIWFLISSNKVLYRNYLYSEPQFKTLNTLLLSVFVVKTLFFFTIFGSLFSDLAQFVGIIGFSIAANGGVRGPVAELAPKPEVNRLRLISLAR